MFKQNNIRLTFKIRVEERGLNELFQPPLNQRIIMQTWKRSFYEYGKQTKLAVKISSLWAKKENLTHTIKTLTSHLKHKRAKGSGLGGSDRWLVVAVVVRKWGCECRGERAYETLRKRENEGCVCDGGKGISHTKTKQHFFFTDDHHKRERKERKVPRF